jgi:protein involved in polysaccharide export with SLBB domain
MVEANFRLLDAIAQSKGISGAVESVRVIRRDERGGVERLIDIPADKLLAGDPKLNLVVRPGDVILLSGREAQTRPGSEKILRLVVGKDLPTFQGRKENWEDIVKALQNEPDRANVILEIVPESDDVTVGRFFDAQRRAGELVKRYGLKYLSVLAREHEVCYIGGNVDRPGAYQLNPEGFETLGEAIETAGIDPAAHPDEIVLLIRRTDGVEQSMELDLQRLLLSKQDRSDPMLIVHAGDKLMVGANPRKKPAE